MTLSILIFFQIIASVFLAEDTVKRTAEGAATLKKLSTMGLFFLRWRANAHYKSELFYLRKVFGRIAIVLTVIYAIFALAGNYDGARKIALVTFLFSVLWSAMKFGTDFKGGIRDQYKTILVCTLSPWLILLADYLTGFQFHPMQRFSLPLILMGFKATPDWLIALFFSGIGLIFGTLTAMFNVLFFSIVPLFFLFLIALTSTLSRRALNVRPDTLKNAALLYTIVLAPILFGLESKGMI